MLRLTQQRVSRGLSKARVARRAGLDQALMSRVESGRYRPYGGELRRIAEALGWEGDPIVLLEEVADPPRDAA